MTKRNSGLCWHVHDKVLCEYCYDYEKRVRVIKENKSAKERPIRLKVMKMVKGKLPQSIIKAVDACRKAREAYDKSLEAYKKTWDAYDNAWDAFAKARDARFAKAWDACDKARDAYTKALETLEKAIEDNMDYLRRLHWKECPNCCWDGKRLDFSKEKQK